MIADARSARTAQPGFTLVELLIVIVIIGLALSMIAFLPKGAQKDSAVQAAAHELASTLQVARSLALDKRAIYAVTFNVECGRGTSGIVLNNWSGGHWYQILGPTDYSTVQNQSSGVATFPYPQISPAWADSAGSFLSKVKGSSVGDRHYLATNKVRFLALTDQDNGCPIDPHDIWNPAQQVFVQGYPRPWFGVYDPATKKLLPWGGYDPTGPLDFQGRRCAGFYYEGDDGNITDSVNPADRIAGGGQIYAKGANRPLINGAWEDYTLIFYPDGSVSEM